MDFKLMDNSLAFKRHTVSFSPSSFPSYFVLDPSFLSFLVLSFLFFPLFLSLSFLCAFFFKEARDQKVCHKWSTNTEASLCSNSVAECPCQHRKQTKQKQRRHANFDHQCLAPSVQEGFAKAARKDESLRSLAPSE